MKKLFIIAILIYSCKTTKLDSSTGDLNPTWTVKHMRNIHKHGFFAGGKWIEYKYEKKLPVRK